MNKLLKTVFSNGRVRRILGRTYSLLRDSYYQDDYAEYRKKFVIHQSFQFYGTGNVLAGDDGNIALGENSYLTRNCILEALEGCKILVGKNCSIGPNVKMFTVGRATNQDLDHTPFGDRKTAHSRGSIVIGDGCWIGADVCIKGGVLIGTNSIIGMNSVVTRDIPPHSVAAGNPARVFKFKSYLPEDERAELVSKYWTSLSDAIKSAYS